MRRRIPSITALLCFEAAYYLLTPIVRTGIQKIERMQDRLLNERSQ